MENSHRTMNVIDKIEKDKATLERLMNDPDAVVEVARERYYMKTEDEDIFIIEEEKTEDE